MGSEGASTLLDKVWRQRVVTATEDGRSLLWIDRHFVHEGSHHAFDSVRKRGGSVARPDLTFGVADHYAPTSPRGQPIADASVATMVEKLSANSAAQAFRLFGLDDQAQGIVHVVAPE